MRFDAASLAAATGGRLLRPGPPGPVVTDTRGEVGGAWFLALRGERFDATAFLPDAAAGGCAGAIATAFPPDWERGAILVADPLAALQDLARAARDRLDALVVGITGSVGKTTTRTLVAAALAPLGVVHQSRGNLNNHVGLPLTLLEAPGDAAAVVAEMGMSGPGEIALLQAIARPDVRLVTNVRPAHLEGTGSLEGVARCKQELFDGARPGDVLVVHQDDPWVAAMPRPAGVRTVRYGRSRDCDVRWIRSWPAEGGLATRIALEVAGRPLDVLLPAPGLHLAENVSAAAAVALVAGTVDGLAERLAAWRPEGMRMRPERVGEVLAINDAYNASPASMRAALETLARIPARRRWAVLGDMLELGAAEAAAHRDVLERALALGIDRLLLAGPRFRRAAAALGLSLPVADEVADLPAAAGELPGPGDVVLLKGSRGMQVERFLLHLRGAED